MVRENNEVVIICPDVANAILEIAIVWQSGDQLSACLEMWDTHGYPEIDIS